ncbi:MAG: hypothetical protein Q9159_007246 [Coniocarpon cinnabarinum]
MPSTSNWLSTPPPPSRPATKTTASTNASSSLTVALRTHLTSRHLPPNDAFLAHLLSSLNHSLPLPSLKASAQYRALHSDLKTSLLTTQSNTLPRDIADGGTAFRTLTSEVTVQVLDQLDISRSLWSQIENIEAAERGETQKGREIVRVVPGEVEGADGGSANATSTLAAGEGEGKGPMKLLLEDGNGTRVWGFEMAVGNETAVAGGKLGSLEIGAKLLLKAPDVARGVVMLEEGKVVVLGGKVEEWAKIWREGRKEALRAGLPPLDDENTVMVDD